MRRLVTRWMRWGVPLAGLVLAAAQAREDAEFGPLSEPAPAVDLRPAAIDVAELDCAQCHAEVAREWAASAHGVAWEDEIYQTEIQDRRRPELCHSCHIPEPLLATGELQGRAKARAEDLHHGVSCRSCHLGPGGVMLGPRGQETQAHGSQTSEWMTGKSDQLCAVCHSTNIGPVIGVAKDFKETRQSEKGRSCVGCHMAPLERRWALSPEGSASEGEESPVRLGRSHALQTPRDRAFLRRAFGWSLVREEGEVRVSVSNQAGHRVPGMIGREIAFDLALSDAQGKTLREAGLVLDAIDPLPADGVREVSLKVGDLPTGSTVLIRGIHLDPQGEAIGFLDLSLDVP